MFDAVVAPLRVAAYFRKSKVTMRDRRVRDRAAAEGISMPLASLAIQREDIERQVALERDGRRRVFVGFFEDVISGAQEDRTGRNQIYRLADLGLIDEVWVWAFDRWSREDAMEAISSVNDLWKKGVKILSSEEPWIDPYGRKDEYENQVWEAFRRSSFERDRMMMRSARGLARVKEMGMVLGHAPFGFRFVDSKDRWSGLEVDPEFRESLQAIFTMRYDGRSLRAISAATGLADSTLSFILHGSSMPGRDRTQGHRQRLRDAVGHDRFDAVQGIKRTVFPGTPTWAWVLRGICECPFCGRTMLGHRDEHVRLDGTRILSGHVYVCSDRRKAHAWRRIRERLVLDHVLAVLDAFATPTDYVEHVIDALRPKERVVVLYDRQKRIAEIEAERRRTELLYKKGRRDYAWWEREDAELDRQIAALPPEMAFTDESVRERAVALRSLADALRSAIDRPEHADGINAANGLLRAVIARIRFAPENKAITIDWQSDFVALLAVDGAIHARPAAQPAPDWVTALEAAESLGWGRQRMRRLLESGSVPGAVVSGDGKARRWRVPRTWLDEARVEDEAMSRPAPEGDWVSASDAARALGWTRQRMRRWLDAGLVPGAVSTGEGTRRRWAIPADWVSRKSSA